MPIQIGPYAIPVPLFMAPMAGVTDLPFRRVVRQWGAGMATGEMLNADTRLWDSRKSRSRLPHAEDPLPRPVQIAGSEPAQLAEAARQAEALGAGIIDINMGCPAKKVCRRAAGSALLADEALVDAIFAAVVASVSIPVTVKIRTGSDPDHRNAVTIARLAAARGLAALTIHGRTRACRFQGQAEYHTIAEVVRAVALPVIANGDIDSPAKARHVLQETGAAGLMIGRAALGRPWIFREIGRALGYTLAAEPGLPEIHHSIRTHLDDLHQYHGSYMGPLLARKQMGWYLDELGLPPSWKARFNQLDSVEQQRELLDVVLEAHSLVEEVAA